MSLAGWCQVQGNSQEGLSLLEEIYLWFEEGFETKDLKAAREMLRDIAPKLRILEATHGRVPLNLMLGSGIHVASGRSEGVQNGHIAHLHGHPFATWHWTNDQPLSLPKLRSAIEDLPDTIYRVKGIVYLEELPSHQVVLQMVGRRYNIGDTKPWGARPPQSEIVMITSQDKIDSDALQHAFDDSIRL